MRRFWISVVWIFTLLHVDTAFGAPSETVQQSAQSYIEMGAKFANHGDLVRAIGAYTIALEFAPDSAEAFFRRALAFEGTGATAKAIADYSVAIHLRPGVTPAWYNRGNLLMA